MQYTNIQQFGNDIFFIGYDDNDNRITERLDFKPSLYVESKSSNTKYKGLFGESLDKIEFQNIREAKDFVSQYKDVSGFNIHGQTNFAYQFITESFPDTIVYDNKIVRTATIDIEVHCEEGFPSSDKADYPINAITHHDSLTDTYFVWATKFQNVADYQVHTKDIKISYKLCQDEFELLSYYLSFWKNNIPDIVSGWNIRFFDIPYIINRYKKLFSEQKAKEFSPWNKVFENNVVIMGRANQTYDIVGVSILDGIDMYKKYTYNKQESYKLDYIAHIELGVGKVKYDGHLWELAKKDHQKFIEYNITDVQRVHQIEQKNKFIDLVLTMAYMAKVNYNDVFGPVKLWEVIIYNHLIEKDIIIPPKKISASKESKYAGAYVKEPQPAAHNWIVSFDLNSLYPSIVRQWNISPETFIPAYNVPRDVYSDLQHLTDSQMISACNIGDKNPGEILSDYNITMSANKQFYRKDKWGVLPEIFTTLYNNRKKVKKEMLSKEQELELIESEMKKRGI